VLWNCGLGQLETAVKKWHKDQRAVFDLPDGHLHQLRDTAAVEGLRAGIPLEAISRLFPCFSQDD